MKNKMIWLMTAVSVVMMAAVLPFLPDEVPMHFDMAGNTDRYGSKFELLLFPGLMLLTTVMWRVFIGYYEKKRASADEKTAAELGNNLKVLHVASIAVTGMFLAMEAIFLVTLFWGAEQSDQSMPELFSSAIGAVLGLVLIVMGNVMPKAKRNAVFGLRTSWSMHNDRTWLASNRFGGAAFVVGGLVVTVLSLLFRGMIVVYLMLGILGIVTIASVLYSYFAYRKYKD